MKYLKKFENINEPKIGDYVICVNYENTDLKILDDFLSSNIGKIVRDKTNVEKFKYSIKFENIPKNLKGFTENGVGDEIIFRSDEIAHFSKNKEDLEHIIDANKYNL